MTAMSTAPEKYARVTLTKAQSASAAGATLVNLLGGIFADGRLDADEVSELRSWLQSSEADTGIVGIRLLRDVVEEALADGVVTADERAEILPIVLRVLPKTEREAVSAQIRSLAVEPSAETAARILTAPEATDDEHIPTCKRWKLFVMGREAAVAILPWQSLRMVHALGVVPDALAQPVDETRAQLALGDLRWCSDPPVTTRREADAILDSQRTTLGARTPVSARQRAILSELGWPFVLDALRHYRHADWLIKWWAGQRGEDEEFTYDDPDSPWSWSRSEGLDADLATEAQLRYLRALGVSAAPSLSKAEASRLIGNAVNARASVSNRQMMVLRFWDRVSLSDKGRSAVSEWMDEWYQENPDRQAAWELWKEENGDQGRQDDPQRVSVGTGWAYLDRVKSPAARVALPERRRGTPWWLVGLLCVLALIAFYLLRER